jgi:hypothetical protein
MQVQPGRQSPPCTHFFFFAGSFSQRWTFGWRIRSAGGPGSCTTKLSKGSKHGLSRMFGREWSRVCGVVTLDPAPYIDSCVAFALTGIQWRLYPAGVEKGNSAIERLRRSTMHVVVGPTLLRGFTASRCPGSSSFALALEAVKQERPAPSLGPRYPISQRF